MCRVNAIARSCYILLHHFTSFPWWYEPYHRSNDHITLATTISFYSLLRDAYHAMLTMRHLLHYTYYVMLTTRCLLDAYYVTLTVQCLVCCLVHEAKHVWLMNLLCSACPPLCDTSMPLLLSPCGAAAKRDPSVHKHFHTVHSCLLLFTVNGWVMEVTIH